LRPVPNEDNPLITQEQIKILEAAVPKYTMKVLLGLSDVMFLTLKNTEYWMRTRGVKQRSKEKHFEFAKDLFKIWDSDGGGFLDVDEISLPLISLGLSTDSGFVEKLIKSLKQKKLKHAEDTMPSDDLSFTLKDFVSIFNADRVGEKISAIVQEECIRREERKRLEEQALLLQNHSKGRETEQVEVERFHSVPKKEKAPSLVEQMEVVDEWWREIDPQKRCEVPVTVAAQLFVRKGISQDEELAKKILLKSINNVRATSITIEQYN
jgi:hypothetical protein